MQESFERSGNHRPDLIRFPSDGGGISGVVSREELRERLTWARRQGNPTWLWPEVAIAEWREALASIERVTRDILVGGGPTPILEGCRRSIGLASYTSGMGPLLGHWLANGKLDASADATAELRMQLQHNQSRMTKMARRAQRVVAALKAHGIPATVLKGMHTAWSYFPEPGTRPLLDVDILVAASDKERCAPALRSVGLELQSSWSMPPQQNWTPRCDGTETRTLNFIHSDNPWSVDLQFTLNRKYSHGASLVDLDRIAERLGPWPLLKHASTLRQPALFLHLAVHASCPLASLSLLRQVELHFVVRRDSASGLLDWNEVLCAANRAGALAIIYPAVRMSEMLAPNTYPGAFLEACAEAAPPNVRRIIDRFSPASAQRVVRCSLEERFMWTPSLRGKLRDLLHELLPVSSPTDLARIYSARLWRLARGTVSR